MSLFKTRVSFAARNTNTKLTEGYLDKSRFRKPPTISDKDKGALFTPGIYPKKSRANETKPLTMGMLAYDLDSAPKGVDAEKFNMRDEMLAIIENIAEGHGIGIIVHTTWRHKKVAPRYRLLIALTKPVKFDEYPVVWEQVRKAFDIPSDKSAARPKQLMYLPYIRADAIADDAYGCVIKDGSAIDPDDFLEPETIAEVEPTDEEQEFADAVNALEHSPLETPPGIDPHNWVRAILSSLDPCVMEYEPWLDVILAVAHQLQHDPIGVEILIDWTQAKGKNPFFKDSTPKDIATKYRTEGRTENPKTLRSLLNLKSSRGTTTILGESYALLMQSATEPAELAELFEFVKRDTYFNSSHNLGRVSTAYRKKYKEIVAEGEDDCPSQKEVRNLLSGKAPIDAPDVDQTLADWFYESFAIQQWDDKVLDIKGGHEMSMRSFNIDYRSKMPRGKDGRYPLPMEVLSQQLFGFKKLRYVVGYKYVVEGEMLYKEGKYWFVNRYVQGSFPIPETPFDENDPLDAEIKSIVERHLSLMGNGDPRASKAIAQWLAHIRQYPHDRQQWGVSILSKHQGIGKSTYKLLAEAVLGKEQVASLTSQQVNEKINSWKAAPKLVSFLDEPDDLKNVKDARVDVDFFKEFMTGENEQIRKHREEWTEADIHTRLAITGNNINTMGEGAGGRRWLTSIVERGSPDYMQRIYGEPSDEFFTRYRALMRDHAERFAAYFDAIDTSDFDCFKVPETAQGARLVSATYPELTKMVLQSALDTKVNRDIGEQIILKPAFRNMIDGLATDDDPDLVRLSGRTLGKMDELIEAALYDMGYLPVSRDKGSRVRAGFESSDRVRVSHVWVKESVLDTRGSTETDKHFIDRVLAGQREIDNVVDMKKAA